MVVEDVHWADDATLDVLRYLAWRIPALPSLLVLTYRDDELRDDHPLRRVLGALASQRVCRLALRPLSPSAVEELAGGRGPTPGRSWRPRPATLFVTEVLANPGIEVPATVRDAVLARLGGLGDPPSGRWSCSPPFPAGPSAGWSSGCSATRCWAPWPSSTGSAPRPRPPWPAARPPAPPATWTHK
jgi:hypothetical protein